MARLHVFVALLLISCTYVFGRNRVMPWMCLERCGATPADIANSLKAIAEHVDSLSAVSFEMYNLADNSQLVVNNLTRVHRELTALGLETYAMVSSYPYPPQFLDWMRDLFANPQPFISACVSEAVKHNITGYNIDFEPTVNAQPADTVNYAAFLTKLADALHTNGKKLTVDVATWNPLWNYTLLSQTTVDRINVMGTYTANDTTWVQQFERAYDAITINKLGIGLETDNANYTDSQLQMRFDTITKHGVQEVDLWKVDVPDSWWPYIETYVKST